MSNEEIEYLCRSGKSYAVAEALLNFALQDSERLIKEVKRDMPRVLVKHLERENEQFRKILGK